MLNPEAEQKLSKEEKAQLEKQRSDLWIETEKKLTTVFHPELCRTSGLLSAHRQRWEAALLRLHEAVSHGVNDLQTLDALGEAAYQSKALEVLFPLQHLYQHPMLATHMARALLLTGQIEDCRKYLTLANDSRLKQALQSLLGLERNIETSIEALLDKNFPKGEKVTEQNLSLLMFPEFWQAVAAFADVAGRKDLTALADVRTKGMNYANPTIHFNQSLRLLNEGEYRAGFRVYDWRLVPGSPCALPTRVGEISMWEGEEISGQTLLVVLENGFGDQIFSLRYLKALQELQIKVEVVADAPLHDLIKASFPGIKIHSSTHLKNDDYWKQQPQIQYWIYSLSIPARAFIFDPIYTKGYLQAPPDLIEKYRLDLTRQKANGPITGLVWHGDIGSPAKKSRAYSLTEFLNVTKALEHSATIVNLQKDITTEELHWLTKETEKRGLQFINAASSLTDFSQTAALLMNLDHFYCADTSVAHLAGALNIPFKIFIRNKAIWFWRATEQQKAIWYNSAEIHWALVPKISFMFEIRDQEKE